MEEDLLNRRSVQGAPVQDAQVIPGLDTAIERTRRYILGVQDPIEGFWVDQVEADVTIPSEYLMFRRMIGRVDAEKERRLVNFIRSKQMEDGGWNLYYKGPADISATIKAYFAMKVAGESPDAPHMAKARRKILEMGGIVNANVFTKIMLATFGQYRWDALPAMPAELALLPEWFFFSMYEVSYWSRTVIVPLLIIFNKRYTFELPPEHHIDELYADPSHKDEPLKYDARYKKDGAWLTSRNFFLAVDKGLRLYEKHKSSRLRSLAISKCYDWMTEHMKGEGGLGAIFPAMVNSVIALGITGHRDGDPLYEQAIKSIEDLEIELEGGEAMYVQPCVSPCWDTPICMNALHEAGMPSDHVAFRRAADWLFKKQSTIKADWKVKAPDASPGGWYFQFENEFYPDVDDTGMVLLALTHVTSEDDDMRVRRFRTAFEWMMKMQGSDGGWGAFDKDNNKVFLNDIPFADHGALLDPSTSDLTGRSLWIMGLLGLDLSYPPAKAAYDFLRREQETDGSWYGRWGVNYIYGTWSVLSGLRMIGEDMTRDYVRRAVKWLKSRQHEDGGWGESCDTYRDPYGEDWPSTASQTAWALISLMQAGEASSPEVKRGVEYLLSTQNEDGYWDEEDYTGTGFPRVFYLRYHMYAKSFPLWALSMYRSITKYGRPRDEEIRLENSHNKFYKRIVE